MQSRNRRNKLPIPNSKLRRSSKLKNDLRAVLSRRLFLGFGVLTFGTSLELGVWCLALLVTSPASAPSPFHFAGTADSFPSKAWGRLTNRCQCNFCLTSSNNE